MPAPGCPPSSRACPPPAGTGLSRRSFLLRSAGLALSVYGAGRLANLPLFEEGIARAQSAGAGTVLVSVFLDGGADSLSILGPTGHPQYRRLRPGLALGEGGAPFSEDPSLTWHPAAAPLSILHAEGKVSVLPAVGYDHPDQSHFVSRHFWEVGALDRSSAPAGWGGCSTGSGRRTTRSRASRSAAASARRWRPPACRSRPLTRRRASASGRPGRGPARRPRDPGLRRRRPLVWSEFGRRAAENGSGTDQARPRSAS